MERRASQMTLIPRTAQSCNFDEGRKNELAACKTLGILVFAGFAQFGLLVKQALYFDRYTKLLAPDLDLVRDYRVVGLDDAGGGDRRLRVM